MATVIPILEYHDLASDVEGGRSFHGPYVLAADKFRAHLIFLRDNGFSTLSLDDLHAGRLPDKPVLLTFDDGHISNLELAFPLLKEFGFTATFFLVADFIGTEDHLGSDQILMMQDAGMSFGSHSVSHPYLLLLDEDEMAREISDSRTRVERVLGRACLDFCIPYGFHNRVLLETARGAGYRTVLTEKMGYHYPDERPFKVLPRFTVKAGISQEQFANILFRHTGGMAALFFKEGVLELAKRVLGCRGYLRLKGMLVRSA